MHFIFAPDAVPAGVVPAGRGHVHRALSLLNCEYVTILTQSGCKRTYFSAYRSADSALWRSAAAGHTLDTTLSNRKFGLNDPYGHVTVQKSGGTFDSDLGRAAGYSGVATVWGFTFGGHTGFTSNILHCYTNNSGSNTYLCGTTYMSDVPILYNTG